jgi:cytochrome P450
MESHGVTDIVNRMGWDFNFALLPYGNLWRTQRRIFHQEFHAKAALRFRPQELQAAHDLLGRLFEAPDDWMSHLRQYVLVKV